LAEGFAPPLAGFKGCPLESNCISGWEGGKACPPQAGTTHLKNVLY